MDSFFRYPGGKAKLIVPIRQRLHELAAPLGDFEYREPFFGGGSVGLSLLSPSTATTTLLKPRRCKFNKIWINDKDVGIASLWTAVIRYPLELRAWLRSFTPSVSQFDELAAMLREETSMPNSAKQVVRLGGSKLAIHQISYSGLGTMSGGPLGGRSQESNYKINCRWNVGLLCNSIKKAHEGFQSVTVRGDACTNEDFGELFCPGNCLIYLDPPYYKKGGELYQHSFTKKTHQRLATLAMKARCPWLLSYDDCAEVRWLYRNAWMRTVGVNYSITKARTKQELLIEKGHPTS